MSACATRWASRRQKESPRSRNLRGKWRARVGIDWHGHNDRGLAVANALSAASAGADRLHATAMGVGERVGNPAMELLLLNLALSDAPRSLTHVSEYCAHFSRVLGVEISDNQPLVGKNAFLNCDGRARLGDRQGASQEPLAR